MPRRARAPRAPRAPRRRQLNLPVGGRTRVGMDDRAAHAYKWRQVQGELMRRKYRTKLGNTPIWVEEYVPPLQGWPGARSSVHYSWNPKWLNAERKYIRWSYQ